jgi:hypothetical protein
MNKTILKVFLAAVASCLLALAAGQDTQVTNDNKLLCMAEMVSNIESRYGISRI